MGSYGPPCHHVEGSRTFSDGKALLGSAPAKLSHRSRFFGSARLPEPAIAGSGYDFPATDAQPQVMPPQAL